MSPLLKLSVLSIAGLAAACGGQGNDLSGPANVPPAAAFGISCAFLACSFSDSSTDVDGRIAAYRWSFGDDAAGETTRDAAHTYAAPGSYTVTLVVTDDSGATDRTTRVVRTLERPNALPVASFGSSCVDLTCSFSDSSTDPDGHIVAYRWSFGDGSADQITRDATHTYAAPGTYTVTLTVQDDRGASDSVTHVIPGIEPANAPPVSSFGTSCVRLACSFSDSSSDVDGNVIGHHWEFGDGEEADALSPAHTYASADVYHVRLTVTDDRGATDVAEREVTVASAAEPAIAVSQSILGFCYSPGMTRNCVVLSRDIDITSIEGTALDWTISSDQPWIVVSPAGGTTPTKVMVSIDLAPLRPIPFGGGYSAGGSVTVSAAGAFNSPLTIPVILYFYATLLPR